MQHAGPEIFIADEPSLRQQAGNEVNVVQSSWPFVADAPPDILIADELPVHGQQAGI